MAGGKLGADLKAAAFLADKNKSKVSSLFAQIFFMPVTLIYTANGQVIKIPMAQREGHRIKPYVLVCYIPQFVSISWSGFALKKVLHFCLTNENRGRKNIEQTF